MDDVIIARLSIIGTYDATVVCLAHKIMHQMVVDRGLGSTEFLAAAILLQCKGLVFFAVCHGSFPE